MGENDEMTLKWENTMARDHLGSADDGAQRARGIIDSIAQILDFLLQQESRDFRAAEKSSHMSHVWAHFIALASRFFGRNRSPNHTPLSFHKQCQKHDQA